MKVIINQPFGVGDILFISPLVKSLDVEHATWPVVDHYHWIKEYLTLPNVHFIKESEYTPADYVDYIEVPFRHADHIVTDSMDCMSAKYQLLGADLELWRTLTFDRNKQKEQELAKLLNIEPEVEYVFVNNNFASPEYNYAANISISSNMRVVEQQYIEGFTLLDWCGVLEKAAEVHTVSTSLFFVIEALQLAVPLHLYPRKPLDKDLSPIKTLISNKWICHE